MNTLAFALRAGKEGENSPALSQLKSMISAERRPYPYIIAVDFDGTLCENHWPEIGRPNRPLLEAVKLLRRLGALLVLWSCREGDDLQDAVDWCAQQGLSFDAVNENCACVIDYFDWNTRKIHADEYWDDRAVAVCFDLKEEL